METFFMRRYSILFIALGLISLSSVSLHAQRALGGHSVILDDGLGHTVTIAIPSPSANYVWTLPAGAPPANMPGGTTNNSILRWDAGTTSWLEDVNILATSGGALTAASFSGAGTGLTGTAASLSIGGNATTASTASALTAAAWASPGTIGSTAANAAAFTLFNAEGTTTINTIAAATTQIGNSVAAATVSIAGGTAWNVSNLGAANFASIGGASQGPGAFTLFTAQGTTNINTSVASSTQIGNGLGAATVSINGGGVWNVASTGDANFKSIGATSPGTGAFTALTANVTTTAADPYNVSASDFTVIETTNGATVNLPATATKGRIIAIVSIPGNNVHISGNGNNINGSSSVVIAAFGGLSNSTFQQPNSIIVIGDGTNWWVIARG
jgi:hypothetical protein